MKFSSSVANKLVILALILFSVSIFLPWVAQELIYFGWSLTGPRFSRVNFQFWSFMIRQNEEVKLFDRFWLIDQRGGIFYYAPWNGRYLGWVFIFILQLLTVAYSIVYVLNLKVSQRLREHHSIWLVILPLSTVVVAVYQLFVQHEIMYQSLSLNPIRPDLGFGIALLSTAILLIAVLGAPEESHLKTLTKDLKRTVKRTWPVLILLFIIALPVVAELQVQTNVSKQMVVEDRKDFLEIHANPALWEPHYSEISSWASFFRARVAHNYPDYAFCVLEVPVVSYGILATLLNRSGYWAGENTPVSLYVSG